MKKTVSSFFWAILLLPFQVWGQQSLNILVNDKENGSPLSGASVQLINGFSSAQTNRMGMVRFRNLKPGNYQLRVSYLGYQAEERAITIPQNSILKIVLARASFLADEVVVKTTRAQQNTATTYRNISKEELAKNNLGQDMPYLLDQTPGVVVTSDAGTGIGYTGIHIRGSDPTRVNVTINGIPYNDSESMGTFWVNMPDFASSVNNIQVQRGVGTSTNGASAFGASLNIQTGERIDTAYAELDNSYGSFNTWKNTVRLGTGLLGGHFAVDGRLSRIISDGYIDRAAADLRSYFLSGAYHSAHSLLRANVFSGKEKTYQAWYGVPESRLHNDVAGMENYAGEDGLDDEALQHLLQSDSRTYNPYRYKNQNDNYAQTHYQLLYSNSAIERLVINGALHFTRGKGYYEEYKPNESFSEYGLKPVVINGQTVEETDLIRQRWLSNNFYGLTFSGDYKANSQLALTLGGAYNEYRGDHYGDITWSQYPLFSDLDNFGRNTDGSFDRNFRYYSNDAKKTDLNVYGKGNYSLGAFDLFADLQYRRVTYHFLGLDRNQNNVQQSVNLSFFNPKLGVTYQFDNNSNLYLSYAIGHKEPIRDDYENSSPDSRPHPEKLQDFEFGYRFSSEQIKAGINAYGMIYKDQLIITGLINDVGEQTRVNVPDSYRAGLEADISWQPFDKFSWNLTAALSRNKIKNYPDYVSDWDSGENIEQIYNNTNIALSPAFVGSNEWSYRPWKRTEIALISKYVSRQYIDNTGSNDRSLNAFFVNNLRLTYHTTIRSIKNIGITFLINNLFDEQYESNGYTWGYILSGQRHSVNYYFPQAGTNFMLGLNLKF